MLIKGVMIFLLVMVVIGMVGNLLFPGALQRRIGRARPRANCPACGRPRIGPGPCDCGKA